MILAVVNPSCLCPTQLNITHESPAAVKSTTNSVTTYYLPLGQHFTSVRKHFSSGLYIPDHLASRQLILKIINTLFQHCCCCPHHSFSRNGPFFCNSHPLKVDTVQLERAQDSHLSALPLPRCSAVFLENSG